MLPQVPGFRKRSISLITLYSVLLALGSNTEAQTIHPGLTGQELVDALVQDYKPATLLTLAHAKDSIYATIDIRGDSVYGIYTDFAVYVTPGEDPSQAVFHDGNGINLEHGWPRSKGATEGTQGYSDMHHLFPTRVVVNSARGTFPFAEVPDHETTTWFYNDQSMSSTPATNIDAYSESVDGGFEPREFVKGDVARAMFYFYTMYRENVDAVAPDFFSDQLADLCAWHIADPVDDREMDRNGKIAAYQEGKHNPFVLDCTLARRAYCPGNPTCTSSTAGGKDAVASVEVRAVGCRLVIRREVPERSRAQIEVYSPDGQRILSYHHELDGGAESVLDVCQLPSGLYIVHIQLSGKSGQQVAVSKVYIP